MFLEFVASVNYSQVETLYLRRPLPAAKFISYEALTNHRFYFLYKRVSRGSAWKHHGETNSLETKNSGLKMYLK